MLRQGPRRPLTFLLLCLAAGLLTTIAIAWIAAATVDLATPTAQIRVYALRPPGVASHPQFIQLDRTTRAAGTYWSLVFVSPLIPLGRAPVDGDPYSIAPSWVRDQMQADFPRPGPWPDHPPSRNGAVAREIVGITAFGWPFNALWSAARARHPYTMAAAYDFDGSWTIPALPSPSRFGPLRIPLYPVWSGLILDTLLYAALLAATALGIRALRRMLRTRRGLCAACAYDLRGLTPTAPCPECGAIP